VQSACFNSIAGLNQYQGWTNRCFARTKKKEWLIMYYEVEYLNQTKNVLERLARGINPLTGKVVEKESFLKQVEIGKCLTTAREVVDRLIQNGGRFGSDKQTKFTITAAQKKTIKLTDGKIGVNEFSRCVNLCLDPDDSKKLTGVELNRRLRKLGILSEAKLADGKSHTTVNARSPEFGFESEHRAYKGEEYEMVVMNEIGKKYLLDNLETIMATELE
jgi:hypothetical protein